MEWQEDFSGEVAIIGMGGRFPGSRNLQEFWQNIVEGEVCVTFFDEEELVDRSVDGETVTDPHYVKAAPLLEEYDRFDAQFFGYNAREAALMDPQHRLLLECAWTALEDAGYDPERYSGKIGIFAGAGMNGYLYHNLLKSKEMQNNKALQLLLHGNGNDYLCTRVAYKLNLSGPALTVQTACSTSLVAVHQACQYLLYFEADMMLAGGVSLKIPMEEGYFYEEGGIFSPDGFCRPFDEKAQGTLFGSGVGLVVLKRLEDAKRDRDHIYAVIKGSALNNDGAQKVGYTAPSVAGQAEVIAEALAMAAVSPATIDYIEAHGTGTPLGDPIEFEALKEVFTPDHSGPSTCAVGSVKANIGHLNAAAGIAGLIKTTLAMYHQRIPPNPLFQQLNPKISLEGTPFYINTEGGKWEKGETPRRAGVSSFGIGGTNVHVILEEAPEQQKVFHSQRNAHLLPLSAKTEAALQRAETNLIHYLGDNPGMELADVAFTLQSGRQAFDHRSVLLVEEGKGEIAWSGRGIVNDKQKSVVFVFPGQGSQYVNMGRELYQTEPEYRKQIDTCAELLKPILQADIRDLLYPEDSEKEEMDLRLRQTAFTQPALFTVEYALAKLLIEKGIQPQAMIGHSLGEYVAACLAGVFSLEDALYIVSMRGRLIQSLPQGKMVSISSTPEELAPYLSDRVSVAAVNGPQLTVVSGDCKAMDDLMKQLEECSIHYRLLKTSHAFHSSMMDPILSHFEEALTKVKLGPQKIPFVSNVTGEWVEASQVVSPGYWVEHLRQAVQFQQGVETLSKSSHRVYIEVGPGRLAPFFQNHPAWDPKGIIIPGMKQLHHRDSDDQVFMRCLGQLWLHGIEVDWSTLDQQEQRRRVPLPTYPFEKMRFWIDPQQHKEANVVNEGEEGEERSTTGMSHHVRPGLSTPYVAPTNEVEKQLVVIWEDVLGYKGIGVEDHFFELGGHSLLATQIMSRMKEVYPVEISFDQLFEEPTIKQLALLIEEKLIQLVEAASDQELANLIK